MSGMILASMWFIICWTPIITFVLYKTRKRRYDNRRQLYRNSK